MKYWILLSCLCFSACKTNQNIISSTALFKKDGFENFIDSHYSKYNIIYSLKEEQRYVAILVNADMNYLIVSQPLPTEILFLSKNNQLDTRSKIVSEESIFVSGFTLTDGKKIDDFTNPSELVIGYRIEISPSKERIKIKYSEGAAEINVPLNHKRTDKIPSDKNPLE